MHFYNFIVRLPGNSGNKGRSCRTCLTYLVGHHENIFCMPRLARLDAPGVLQHVIGRGIERKEIFLNRLDRNDFISRLGRLAQDGAWVVYAWALLPNHFHLLCKTHQQPLSSSMRKLLTGYAVNFNRRHRTSRPSFPKPIQIDCVSGRCLPAGTGSLYSSEPPQGGFGERYERTEPKSVVRSFCIDRKCGKGVAGIRTMYGHFSERVMRRKGVIRNL